MTVTMQRGNLVVFGCTNFERAHENVHIMVIFTNYKDGDFYMQGYHIKCLVSFVSSVTRSKHISVQMTQLLLHINMFRLHY